MEHKYDELCKLIQKDRHARKSGTGVVKPSHYSIENGIETFGRRLFRLLNGKVGDFELKGLADRKGHLQLCLDEHTRILPWELVFDGSYYLCTKYSVARISNVKNPTFQSDSKIRHERRALVLGLNYRDYRDDLSPLYHCVKEAEIVASRLKEMDFTVLLKVNEKANRKDVLKALRDGVDVFHFTGHASFNSQFSHDKSGKLCLCDRDLTARDLDTTFSETRAPLLSFMNGCESGREEYPDYTWEPHKGMASAFLEHGAGVFIGTFWPVDDESANLLSVKFYSKLSEGATIAKAMRSTRLFYGRKESAGFKETWPAYVLYGDPELRFTTP